MRDDGGWDGGNSGKGGKKLNMVWWFNLICQLGWAMVSRELIEHYSRVSVRVFLD